MNILYKVLKSLSLTGNVKLAEIGECQIGMDGFLGSTLLEVIFLMV